MKKKLREFFCVHKDLFLATVIIISGDISISFDHPTPRGRKFSDLTENINILLATWCVEGFYFVRKTFWWQQKMSKDFSGVKTLLALAKYGPRWKLQNVKCKCVERGQCRVPIFIWQCLRIILIYKLWS